MQLRSRSRFYRITIRIACGVEDDELQVWLLEEQSVCGKIVSVAKDWGTRVGEPSCRKNHGQMVRLRRSVTGFSTIAASAGARHPPACYRGPRVTSLQLSGASKDGCSIETSVRPSPGP